MVDVVGGVAHPHQATEQRVDVVEPGDFEIRLGKARRGERLVGARRGFERPQREGFAFRAQPLDGLENRAGLARQRVPLDQHPAMGQQLAVEFVVAAAVKIALPARAVLIALFIAECAEQGFCQGFFVGFLGDDFIVARRAGFRCLRPQVFVETGVHLGGEVGEENLPGRGFFLGFQVAEPDLVRLGNRIWRHFVQLRDGGPVSLIGVDFFRHPCQPIFQHAEHHRKKHDAFPFVALQRLRPFRFGDVRGLGEQVRKQQQATIAALLQRFPDGLVPLFADLDLLVVPFCPFAARAFQVFLQALDKILDRRFTVGVRVGDEEFWLSCVGHGFSSAI